MDFPLEILPGGGFDSSILTVVFVGLIVLWMLTETMGFVFIGLVVPGYLASVLIIAPTTAVVVLLESVVTYMIVWLLADVFSRINAWSVFFGRDRFFAFVLTSLFVRLIGEMWLWPEAWSWWVSVSGYEPHLPGALTSVGLVLVPLTANMFWKVGAVRGLWQLALPTGLVYFVTRELILPLTNLRFSEFQVHYEDVAIDIIASPKAYVIMLVTAAIAARVNIRFGWDFGGILIPALLAISWFDITKGFVTVAEAVVLAIMAGFAMQRAPFNRINLEGPRRIVFVFAMGFALKLLIGWIVYLGFPHVRITDFFGFGYLLSSLLALKILAKRSASLVLVPAVLVSIVGFIAGGLLVGMLGLTFDRTTAEDTRQMTSDLGALSIEDHLVEASVMTSTNSVRLKPIDGHELHRWETLVQTINEQLSPNAMPGQNVESQLEALGLEIQAVHDGAGRALVVGEPATRYPDARGWGIFVFRPGATGPALLIPELKGRPINARGIAKFARAIDAKYILFGATSVTPAGRTMRPTEAPSSPYHIAVRTLKLDTAVELRDARDSQLFLGSSVERTFPLDTITRWTPGASIEWSPPKQPTLQSSNAARNFVVAALSPRRYLAWAARGEKPVPANLDVDLESWMSDMLFSNDRRFARTHSEFGAPLNAFELEVANRAVLEPLLRQALDPGFRELSRDRFKIAAAVARALNLELSPIEHDGHLFYALRESGPPFRGWGMTLIRADAGHPLLIEAPSPAAELSTWRFSMHAALALRARAISFGGLHHLGANLTQAPPMPLLAQRVATKHALERNSLIWTVQIRGFSDEHMIEHDAILSHESPLRPRRHVAEIDAVKDWLEQAGLRTEIDIGQPTYARFRGLPDDTFLHARAMTNGRFARIWLSADFRALLSPSPDIHAIRRAARRLGIDLTTDLSSIASQHPESNVATDEQLETWMAKAQQFSRTRNPIHLGELAKGMRLHFGNTPMIWHNSSTGQVWLVAKYDRGTLGIRIQETLDHQVELEQSNPIANLTAGFFIAEEP